jgi:16S rRNA (adenine1518-N6/adenine1519-N6)-dimethyltransferase
MPPPPSRQDPRSVLERHGLSAKKSWGQNFLVDRNIHDKIVRAAGATAEDVVVEIGAGLGTLTIALLGAEPPPRQILAVERDPDMLHVLGAELAGHPRVDIRGEDATHFDFGAAARAAGRPLLVVGNLPYQITSPLLFALVDAGPAIRRAVVMVQRELAERMVAPPGSKIYGRLSVMVQHRMDARMLFHVAPGSFFPRPRVVSAVISLEPRPALLAPVRDPERFARVVKIAFSTRRKMLRRSLGDGFGDTTAAEVLARAGVDGERRPEELSVAEFARLADGFDA